MVTTLRWSRVIRSREKMSVATDVCRIRQACRCRRCRGCDRSRLLGAEERELSSKAIDLISTRS